MTYDPKLDRIEVPTVWRTASDDSPRPELIRVIPGIVPGEGTAGEVTTHGADGAVVAMGAHLTEKAPTKIASQGPPSAFEGGGL